MGCRNRKACDNPECCFPRSEVELLSCLSLFPPLPHPLPIIAVSTGTNRYVSVRLAFISPHPHSKQAVDNVRISYVIQLLFTLFYLHIRFFHLQLVNYFALGPTTHNHHPYPALQIPPPSDIRRLS